MRPARIALPDFAGRNLTLDTHPASWRRLNPGRNDSGPILCLGLGPAGAPPLQAEKLYWLDAPQTLASLSGLAGFSMPEAPGYIPATPGDISGLAKTCRIYFYQPGLRLAPDFWGPVLASLGLAAANRPLPPRARSVWLPGSERQLLYQELSRTLPELGFTPVSHVLPAAPSTAEFLDVFNDGLPAFALSVNFRGLDSGGVLFHLLEALDIPVAVWLVDNPWHLVSGISLPWWKKAWLFVTDRSFVKPLADYGARNVFFCPLATAPHMWRKPRSWPPSGSPLFIGRASFPDRAAFFGNRPPDPALMREAANALTSGEFLPDYHWWAKKLGGRLWPGFAGRQPGLGADACSSLNRARWLSAAPSLKLAGDPAWNTLPGNRNTLPPVDYYTALPDLYAASPAVLNVTSLLLPESLNQRHFDVWAAGSLLLGDNTKGLEIFPPELTAPMTLTHPEEFEQKLAWYNSRPVEAAELISAWREELAANHSYGRRLEFIISKLPVSNLCK